MKRTYSSASINAGSVMSTWNAKLRLKFCQCLPGRPDPALLSGGYAKSNRLHGFQSFKAIEDLLVTLRVLYDQLGFAVDGKDHSPMRLLQPAHEGTRFPLEVREGVDILAQIKHVIVRILKASLTMLSCVFPTPHVVPKLWGAAGNFILSPGPTPVLTYNEIGMTSPHPLTRLIPVIAPAGAVFGGAHKGPHSLFTPPTLVGERAPLE